MNTVLSNPTAAAGARLVSRQTASGATSLLSISHNFLAMRKYMFHARIIGATGLGTFLLEFNGDTTAANYERGVVQSTLSSAAGAQTAAHAFTSTTLPGGSCCMDATLTDFGDTVVATVKTLRESLAASNGRLTDFSLTHAGTVTSIAIRTATVNDIAAGSVIELWEY